MHEELPFQPFFLFQSSHQQTIMGSFLIFHWIHPSSKTKHVKLPDEDCLAIEVSTPKNWREDDLTVVMLHGLCGSHKSSYLVRMTKKLLKKGIRAIRINLRGCGSGKGLAKHIYHSGQSDDIFEVLKVLKEETPHSPIVLMGFSLGGNIVLKLSGELKEQAFQYIDKVIALNPPVDLLSSVHLFNKPANMKYQHYFLRLLREDLIYRYKKFPELEKVELPNPLDFMLFDELITAPLHGFTDPLEYYEKCSAKNFVAKIEVPCRILLAEDDPIISSTSLDDLDLPEHVQVYKTKKGGHLGYLGHPNRNHGGFYWLDHVLLKWIHE